MGDITIMALQEKYSGIKQLFKEKLSEKGCFLPRTAQWYYQSQRVCAPGPGMLSCVQEFTGTGARHRVWR